MSAVRNCVVATAVLGAAAAGSASGAELASVRASIESARIDPGNARTIGRLNLEVGQALVEIRGGVVYPVGGSEDDRREIVFLGRARVRLSPQDPVERQQLELFSGREELDTIATRIVFAVARPDAARALLAGSPLPAPDPAREAEAASLLDAWRARPERRRERVGLCLAQARIEDGAYDGYFAGWFRGAPEGDFLLTVDPDRPEPTQILQFVPEEFTDLERQRHLDAFRSEQRKGRLRGLEFEEYYGHFDTWVSLPLRTESGEAVFGVAPFTPVRYVIDAVIERFPISVSTVTGVRARASAAGRTALRLAVSPDVEVSSVRDGSGTALAFVRENTDLLVELSRPTVADEEILIEVASGGRLIDDTGQGGYSLRDTLNWHPRIDVDERATFEATFHYPKGLDLLAMGKLVDSGLDGGTAWERRRLDEPAVGFTFEVGKFRIETVKVGHVEIRIAFDPVTLMYTSVPRERIVSAVEDSFRFFEETFGPYPLDYLTVATVNRDADRVQQGRAPRQQADEAPNPNPSPLDFDPVTGERRKRPTVQDAAVDRLRAADARKGDPTQGYLGFVTIAADQLTAETWYREIYASSDARTIIAREMARQWWGHLVGWRSYHDRWISEAIATYAANIFAKWNPTYDDKGNKRTSATLAWPRFLQRLTKRGLPVEELGPVVLGDRLASSFDDGAYEAVVYLKGAVVLDSLSRYFANEKAFLDLLRSIVDESRFRQLTTRGFLALLSRKSALDLDPFASRFIYGTGLPNVFYRYAIEPAGEGRWIVSGSATKYEPFRFRYRVVSLPDGRRDLARTRVPLLSLDDFTLVVPTQLSILRSSEPPPKKNVKTRFEQGNSVVDGRLVLDKPVTTFEVPFVEEPKGLWMDLYRQTFALCYSETDYPKKTAYFRGVDAWARGKAADAEAAYREALAAPGDPPDDRPRRPEEKEGEKQESRIVDVLAEIGLAHLAMDRGDLAAAAEHVGRANTNDAFLVRITGRDLAIVNARLEVLQGKFADAQRRLDKRVFSLLEEDRIYDPQAYALLAIAAKGAGDEETSEKARLLAVRSGVEMGNGDTAN